MDILLKEIGPILVGKLLFIVGLRPSLGLEALDMMQIILIVTQFIGHMFTQFIYVFYKNIIYEMYLHDAHNGPTIIGEVLHT